MFWGVQMCLKVCTCDLHSCGAGYSHVMISCDHSHDPSPALEHLDRMWQVSARTVHWLSALNILGVDQIDLSVTKTVRVIKPNGGSRDGQAAGTGRRKM